MNGNLWFGLIVIPAIVVAYGLPLLWYTLEIRAMERYYKELEEELDELGRK